MAKPETVAVGRVDNTLICVHNAQPADNREWKRVIEIYGEVQPERARALVYSVGGGPNSQQRAELVQRLKDLNCDPRMALVTTSVLIRGAGMAVRWFMPHLRFFDPTEIEKAMDFLEVAAHERRGLWKGLFDLCDLLEVPRPPAAR